MTHPACTQCSFLACAKTEASGLSGVRGRNCLRDRAHATRDDDEKVKFIFFPFQILFPVWVTLSEHKRVILRERPRNRAACLVGCRRKCGQKVAVSSTFYALVFAGLLVLNARSIPSLRIPLIVITSSKIADHLGSIAEYCTERSRTTLITSAGKTQHRHRYCTVFSGSPIRDSIPSSLTVS